MAEVSGARAEELANELVAALKSKLARAEDAEAAVSVYRTANWIISLMEEVKTAALNLAEQDMKQRNLEHLRTAAGTAGWTEPKVKQLNEQAWREAISRDAELMRIQRAWDMAAGALEQAQEPFTEVPESRFYIR